VYFTKPRDFDELKNAIKDEIRAMPDNMVRGTVRTLCDRLEQCRQDGVKHQREVVFKK
jgi:hypothetical protein